MNDTLSMLTGLLGGRGGYGNKSGQGQSSVTDSMRQADPLYYGQSDTVTHWDDGTTTMGEDTLKRKKKENPNPWEGKTVADDALAMQRKYPEDSLVAHISPWEADLLSALGGAGTVNPGTGLLQFGWAGGGGDSDGESDSDYGGGSDEGNDGGFHDDRDSGYDGGDGEGDQSGWGGKFSREGSSYGSSSAREASAAASDRYNADVAEQGPIGRQFQGAYQTGMAMAPRGNTVSENMDGLSPVERSSYFGNVSAVNEGPFGKETGFVRDNTPTSRAGSMFSQAQQQQLLKAIDIGSAIDQGLMSAGYNPAEDTGYKMPEAPLGGTWSALFAGDIDPRVTSDYGYRTHPVTGQKNKFHNGTDLAAPLGTAVTSATNGVVDDAGYDDLLGNYARVKDENGYSYTFGHLGSTGVAPGDAISAGDVIGKQGKTGRVTGDHLHYSVRDSKGNSVDPSAAHGVGTTRSRNSRGY